VLKMCLLLNKTFNLRVFWILHSDIVEDFVVLGYDATLLGRFSTFRRNRLPSDLPSYSKRI